MSVRFSNRAAGPSGALYRDHRRKLAMKAAVAAFRGERSASPIATEEALEHALAALEAHGFKLASPEETTVPGEFILALASIMPPVPLGDGREDGTMSLTEGTKAAGFDAVCDVWSRFTGDAR